MRTPIVAQVVLTATMVVLTATVGCQYLPGSVGSRDSAGPGSSGVTTATAAPQDLQRAQAVLDSWHALKSAKPGDAVVVTDDMTAGGGWDGSNAGDDKEAVISGALIASPPLSTAVPQPGKVEWSDGSTQSVELISAADALQGLIDETEAQSGGKCQACTPLVVTGARLATASHATTRGSATLPVWQFTFQPEHQPMEPISYVAVKDAISHADSASGGDNNQWAIDDLDAAYGSADSTELTLTFFGAPHAGDSPCGADYSAVAVESDDAVAVVITESHRAGVNTFGVACTAEAAYRTAVAHLGRPLGDRVVLEIRFGTPVALMDGPAPSDSLRN